MSVEDARACLRRLIDDPAFMAEVRGAAGPAERRAVVQGAGYDFNLTELAEARSLELSDEESLRIGLADEEVENAVGGSSGCGWTHESEGHCGFTHEAEWGVDTGG